MNCTYPRWHRMAGLTKAEGRRTSLNEGSARIQDKAARAARAAMAERRIPVQLLAACVCAKHWPLELDLLTDLLFPGAVVY